MLVALRKRPILLGLARTILLALIVLAGTSAAFADVFGRLQFSVKNADDETPVAGAKITLHDTAGVHADMSLLTDKDGAALSQPLEIRLWNVAVSADLFQSDTRQVQVSADTSTPVEVLLEPLKEKVIKITGQKQLVASTQTSDAMHRDQSFVQTYPLNVANPLSLPSLEIQNPGFVGDSVNQVHPRGEHCGTTISIDGFDLPGANQGRVGQVITPSDVQSADILTGSYAPEYGGETAAILNLNLRSGSIKPTEDISLGGGMYSEIASGGGILNNFLKPDGSNSTFDVDLSGQLGPRIDSSSDSENSARKFGYFIDLDGRRTDMATEAPQPDQQTAHNAGSDENFFGKFDFTPETHDKFSLTLNDDPAYSQIANRTGLPNNFASVGQGYGFGGELSAAQAAAEGIGTQQADGQDIDQRDLNQFAVLNWQHTVNPTTTSNVSVGFTKSDLNLTNNNPAINLSAGVLPQDNSIEYNPTLTRDSEHVQAQGSLTSTAGTHTFKFGGLFDNQSGNESYQFIPGSQYALDALATLDPALAPAGSFALNPNGSKQTDTYGNYIFNLNGANEVAPTLNVSRSGYYGAAYAQDTWDVTRKFTANYGLRFDTYYQNETQVENQANIGNSIVNLPELSPRVNLAYKVATNTVFRTSYDKLFTEPPLAQGAILGQPILPQISDQYEVSLERQVTPRQVAKLSYYIKTDKNQIDVGLLIPNTQIGAYTAVNFNEGHVKGLEFSYNFLPERDNHGWSSFFNYTNSIAKPTGLDNTGAPVPDYNDHDQLNTVTAGTAYAWRSGLTAAADVYYGSGTTSSIIFDGVRTSNTQLNCSLSTAPTLFGHVGFALSVENLLDSRQALNFESGFSGTRFQQGRCIMLSALAHY